MHLAGKHLGLVTISLCLVLACLYAAESAAFNLNLRAYK